MTETEETRASYSLMKKGYLTNAHMDYSYIKAPDIEFLNALDRYVEERVPPGDFLLAVLENNLKESVARATENGQRNLIPLVHFLYNAMPMNIWGSKDKVAAWLYPG